MSTVLYPSPIFGPIHSRRLGISLGINLLPADGKICSFDCIYCECGFNKEHTPKLKMPTKELVEEKLKEKLIELAKENMHPNTLTFAGNGEPTSHPDFLEIIKNTIRLRNAYCPQAKISVLSNSTHILKPRVFEALMLIDNPLLKLDTVDSEFIQLVDRPTSKYDLAKLIEKMKEFSGKCIIQTMFLKGRVGNQEVNNTSDKYVLPWLDVLKEIKPKLVTIYTIDRETPCQDLQKATHAELDSIAQKVKALGLDVSVSY